MRCYFSGPRTVLSFGGSLRNRLRGSLQGHDEDEGDNNDDDDGKDEDDYNDEYDDGDGEY